MMLIRDLRCALRGLARSPLPSTASVVSLALALGAVTTVFSVIDGVLLTPLPYPDPSRLVVVWEEHAERGWEESRVAPAKLEAVKASGIFERVSAYAPTKLTLTGKGEPVEVRCDRVTPDLFTTLGVPILAGRPFRDAESVPGHSDVVVLSEGFWHRRFGADPGVVGSTVVLDGRPHRVLGVAEAVGPFTRVDLWTPLALESWESRVARFLHVIARLPEGRSLEQARRGLDRLSATLVSEYPDTDRGWSLRGVAATDQLLSKTRPALWILFAAVVLVLLTACANVATMLLARGAARSGELAIRRALGAGRVALVRMIALEALCLALPAGALGSLLSVWAVRAVLALAPGELTGLDQVSVGLGSVAFALAGSVLCALLIALWPSVQSWRIGSQAGLRPWSSSSGRQTRASAGFGRLVSAQTAVALVLLAAAGLMIESFAELQRSDLGFQPAELVAARLSLPRTSYDRGRDMTAFYEEVLARLERHPAVASVAATSALPLSGRTARFRFVIEGDLPRANAELPTADYEVVSPGYFRTMGIPLIAGQGFSTTGERQGAGQVVISRSTARRYWPQRPVDPSRPGGGGPLGERIGLEGPDGPWLTIVGVVEDVRRNGPGRDRDPSFYAPFGQDPWPSMTIVVRSRARTGEVESAIKSAVWSVDPELPVPEVFPVETRLTELVARPRFVMVLLAVFGLSALVLTSIGIYGVMSYTVSLVRPEIAVRMSLGAARADVVRHVVAGAARVAALGIGAGLVASWAATSVMRNLLSEVGGIDARILVVAALVLTGTTMLAALVPALRASRVNPAEVLRS